MGDQGDAGPLPVAFAVIWGRTGDESVCLLDSVGDEKAAVREGVGLDSGEVVSDGGLKTSWASARAFSSHLLRTESMLLATLCEGVHRRVPLGVLLAGWGNMPRPETEPLRDSDAVRSSSRVWYANAPGAPDSGGDCCWPLLPSEAIVQRGASESRRVGIVNKATQRRQARHARVLTRAQHAHTAARAQDAHGRQAQG